MEKIIPIYLEITSWAGLSLGATHYYGKLFLDWDNTLELTHKLTQKESIILNKKHGEGSSYKPGQEYYGFDTKDEIIKLGVEIWKSCFPKANTLILGGHTTCEPQLILEGPKNFKNKVNGWVKEFESLSLSSRNDRKRMDELSDLYWDYFCEVTKG